MNCAVEAAFFEIPTVKPMNEPPHYNQSSYRLEKMSI